jgi:hypothetical protein
MIGIGAPIARPVVRDPGWFQTCNARRPLGVREPGGQVGHGRDDSKESASASDCEGAPRRVEYRVRAARITDIEALVALSGDRLADGASGSLGAADVLRQLVFLPHATVLVAESKRDIVGGAVLAIRPSVRAGGYVGVIDLLVVDPAGAPDAVSASLIEECLKSAGNKGCASVEAPQPEDPAELKRWKRQGFKDEQPVLRRAVDPAGRRR